jgi:hypothetical protein
LNDVRCEVALPAPPGSGTLVDDLFRSLLPNKQSKSRARGNGERAGGEQKGEERAGMAFSAGGGGSDGDNARPPGGKESMSGAAQSGIEEDSIPVLIQVNYVIVNLFLKYIMC